MEKFVISRNLKIWTQSFGNKKNPALILIMGVAGQGIFWTDSFCEKLAKNFFVIRYDHVDTGLSDHINYMLNPYSMHDLAHDIISILDDYQIEKAHLLGSSMGGYLAQICMNNNWEKLISITLLMSTVDFSSMGKAAAGTLAANDLPAPKKDILEGLKTIGIIDQANFEEWLLKTLKVMKLFNGKECVFNEKEWVPILEKAYSRRNKNIVNAAIHNHVIACAQGPVNFYNVKQKCPVHVIHGSADPVIPIEHALKTSKHYNAHLSVIKEMGHLRSKIFEDLLIEKIQTFFASI